MKVLIVTYYWPPAGGSGVQRWLKFVKYLRDFGIEPIVYVPKNANYPIKDNSLQSDIPKNIKVVTKSIVEPNTIFSFFKPKKTKQSAGFLESNPSLLGRLFLKIRANYFIPDARKFWIKPSIKFLKKYLLENEIDAIITTGPPHSLHLIGLALKGTTGIPWISDFRDPWTDIDYFYQLPLSNKSKAKHHLLEKKVLKNADAVLVVGETMKENFSSISNNIHVISNGYDTDTKKQDTPIQLDTKFTITHIGLMNADRNPIIFWEALHDLIEENQEFKNDVIVKLIGKLASQVEESIDKLPKSIIDKVGYVSHNEVKKYQLKSQVLLLAINNVPSAKGIITGKIFEYLQAKRPILAIGPKDGDLAEILKNTNSGTIVDFDEKEALKSEIFKLYSDYKTGNLKIASINIEQYHRKNLTAQLAQIIKTIK
ncbi:glycosyltransferase family 4 protein [uncultured Polaribacter sp.]|uniref:glycosyltransferase family 4 protein n=1 Tax=uncultured Polaribacter sp. TaxID=174711 RepID=UPI002639625D|nr:glycosyltransferase family 4 protein [uncultured Polaribacter sp.]